MLSAQSAAAGRRAEGVSPGLCEASFDSLRTETQL